MICICLDLHAVSKFDIAHLYLLNGSTGDEYRAINSLQHRWKAIAYRLGFEYPKVTSIENEGKDDEECLVKVMHMWINKEHSLIEYEPSWEGLYKLLVDLEQGTQASTLRSIVDSFQ